MTFYQAIRDEIDADPLTRGYSTMSDVEVADDMNTVYRSVDRASMSASEVLNTVDVAEWIALTETEQRQIWDVLHMGGQLNPFGNEAQMFINVFGLGSDTITALADARTVDASRAQELGLPPITEGAVTKARAL